MYDSKQITLYIPCYNANSTIEKCVMSLLQQTVTPSEIYLVNDGSTEVLPDLPVLSIEHPENLGLASARNTALSHCKTPLIASIDSDVVVDSNWLEKLLERMNQGGVVGVAGRLDEFHKVDIGDCWRARHMAQHWGAKALKNPRFLFGANTLMKTETLRELGGFDPRCRTNNEDHTMCQLIYGEGLDLAYEPSAMCSHLRRDTALTILNSYWGWHHAKGLASGDFDTSVGLIDRIKRVNFGISDYRYSMDQVTHSDFAVLDLLIPLIFAFKDIGLFCQQTKQVCPSLTPLVEALGLNPEELAPFIPESSRIEPPDWFISYLSNFKNCAVEFMFKERWAQIDFSKWLQKHFNDSGILL